MVIDEITAVVLDMRQFDFCHFRYIQYLHYLSTMRTFTLDELFPDSRIKNTWIPLTQQHIDECRAGKKYLGAISVEGSPRMASGWLTPNKHTVRLQLRPPIQDPDNPGWDLMEASPGLISPWQFYVAQHPPDGMQHHALFQCDTYDGMYDGSGFMMDYDQSEKSSMFLDLPNVPSTRQLIIERNLYTAQLCKLAMLMLSPEELTDDQMWTEGGMGEMDKGYTGPIAPTYYVTKSSRAALLRKILARGITKRRLIVLWMRSQAESLFAHLPRDVLHQLIKIHL